jgi:hypothetical protein
MESIGGDMKSANPLNHIIGLIMYTKDERYCVRRIDTKLKYPQLYQYHVYNVLNLNKHLKSGTVKECEMYLIIDTPEKYDKVGDIIYISLPTQP